MAKKLLHVCTGCGAEKMLAPDKKHYCDCNPGAKFVFMVKSDRELSRRMVAAFKPAHPAAEQEEER